MKAELDQMKRDIKQKKREFDLGIAQKNTKINNLMTDLENLKTDAKYWENKVSTLKLEKQDQIQQFQDLDSSYKTIIQQHEVEKESMQAQLQKALLKDVIIKKMEIEMQNAVKQHQQKR